jgi:hypothetical protein
MPKTIRRLASGSAGVLAVLLCSPLSAADQAPAPVPVTPELLRMAHDEFLRCGQMAVQAGKAPPPKTLNDAKSVLGVNCMTEYNLLVSLVEVAVGRRPTIEEINQGFDSSATLLMAPSATVRATAAEEKSAKSGEATTAAQASPASCKGSVKKGLKAYNAGSFETALCHWLPKARAGDAAAQNNMGLLFERGLTADTPRSDEQAAAWFRLAAEQGLTMAMRNLAGVHVRRGASGDEETARSWIALADATDAQNRLIQEQQRAQALAILAAGLACALGGCTTPATTYAAPTPSLGYERPRSPGATAYRPLDLGDPMARVRAGSNPMGSSRLGVPGRLPLPAGSSVPAMRLCPDGSYVAGTCHMAPDGTYLGGPARVAPDGSYVEQGRVRVTPNGGYVGGNGRMILCPDGTYVTGERCVMAPNGKYIGQ